MYAVPFLIKAKRKELACRPFVENMPIYLRSSVLKGVESAAVLEFRQHTEKETLHTIFSPFRFAPTLLSNYGIYPLSWPYRRWICSKSDLTVGRGIIRPRIHLDKGVKLSGYTSLCKSEMWEPLKNFYDCSSLKCSRRFSGLCPKFRELLEIMFVSGERCEKLTPYKTHSRYKTVRFRTGTTLKSAMARGTASESLCTTPTEAR